MDPRRPTLRRANGPRPFVKLDTDARLGCQSAAAFHSFVRMDRRRDPRDQVLPLSAGLGTPVHENACRHGPGFAAPEPRYRRPSPNGAIWSSLCRHPPSSRATLIARARPSRRFPMWSLTSKIWSMPGEGSADRACVAWRSVSSGRSARRLPRVDDGTQPPGSLTGHGGRPWPLKRGDDGDRRAGRRHQHVVGRRLAPKGGSTGRLHWTFWRFPGRDRFVSGLRESRRLL